MTMPFRRSAAASASWAGVRNLLHRLAIPLLTLTGSLLAFSALGYGFLTGGTFAPNDFAAPSALVPSPLEQLLNPSSLHRTQEPDPGARPAPAYDKVPAPLPRDTSADVRAAQIAADARRQDAQAQKDADKAAREQAKAAADAADDAAARDDSSGVSTNIATKPFKPAPGAGDMASSPAAEPAAKPAEDPPTAVPQREQAPAEAPAPRDEQAVDNPAPEDSGSDPAPVDSGSGDATPEDPAGDGHREHRRHGDGGDNRGD